MDSKGAANDWHWADIKAALAKKGYTLTRLSREKGYKYHHTPGRLKYVRWPDLEKTIADIIGVQPMEIWPSRYDSAGKPLGLGIRQKRSA